MEPAGGDIKMAVILQSFPGSSSSHSHPSLSTMDAHKDSRAYFFGRLFNDKQTTPSMISTSRSDNNLPDVVPQAQREPKSKWKKMEKARRFMIDIIEKSAPCLFGDPSNHADDTERDTGMDFSPEPFYQECAALMVPAKDMARVKEIVLLPKPAVVRGPTSIGRPCSWHFYTPPNSSILSSPASGCLMQAEEEETPDKIVKHGGSLTRKGSRWSTDSEDSVFARPLSGGTLTRPAPVHGSDKCLPALPPPLVQDFIKSTIPFPRSRDTNIVGSGHDSYTARHHDFVNPNARVFRRAILSSCGSTYSSGLSDDGWPSSPASTAPSSSPSTTSTYSQESDVGNKDPDASLLCEEPLVEDHLAECHCDLEKAADIFEGKGNRRGGIFTDCDLVLGALGIIAYANEKIESRNAVVMQDDTDLQNRLCITTRDSASWFNDVRLSDLTCVSGRCPNVAQPEDHELPMTLLPTHISLRNAARKNKSEPYVVHPPGSRHTSPEPQAVQRF